MHKDRLQHLIKYKNIGNKKYVLYWMQQSARVEYNHALNHAIQIANKEDLPLLVIFSLTKGYLGANLRHYQFLLEGLKEVEEKLSKRDIKFVIKYGVPDKTIIKYLENAHTLIMDYGYLKLQKAWRRNIYNYIKDQELKLNLDIVESDVLVPVKKLYQKTAYGAYILRPHLMDKMPSYRDFEGINKISNKAAIEVETDVDLSDVEEVLKDFEVDRSVKPYSKFRGGYSQAIKHIENFIRDKAELYPDRSDPSLGVQSYLSPYLHFGQISTLQLIDIMEKALKDKKINKEVYDAYIEQLVVRRELSFNFVTYRDDYDTFENMTESWAYDTMRAHVNDEREIIYSLKEIEFSKTDDKYFNAAMTEMRITGYMAGYMRMYWAKKIIEWTKDYKTAFNNTLYLNNKYFLDGRDPNSYASVAWVYGKNDRPWRERDVFGKLRYMNANGLKRKFAIENYVEQINDIEKNVEIERELE